MKSNSAKILIPLTMLLSNVSAQQIKQLDDENMLNIENVIEDYVYNKGVPGIGVGIIYNGKIAYSKGEGFSKTFPTSDVFTSNTRSLLASVSKTITGILAMQMVKNGVLGLDSTVDNYITGYSGSAITIRHLLAHQSGIAHYGDCPGGYDGIFDADESLEVVQGCSICFTPPGSATLYSTFGNILLGVIIDKVGRSNYNKGYIELYQDWIRVPGGLTFLLPAHDNSNPDLAQGHSSSGSPTLGSWSDIGWKLPAGGFISNITDLARYGAGIMNYTFLDSVFSEMMWADQSTTGNPEISCQEDDASGGSYGLTFSVSSSNDDLRISHNGTNGHGYRSLLYLYPRQRTGIVLLINKDISNTTLSNIRSSILQYVVCPGTRNFTSAIDWPGNWVYEASADITAENEIIIGAGAIVYDAGASVTLKPGFHATTGTNFRAIIDGCLNSVRPTNSQ